MTISKLLVANRGEIARRVLRTAREMGIATVAVFSEPDAEAPFVREADEAAALGGRTPAESYLRVDALVDVARRSGADAVHPGYGFLAEDPAFARAVLEAGLVWVGPPPDIVAAMGSKLEARRAAAAAGVPVVPGSERADEASAAEVGFPLLVKASAGGGGRGMRIVEAPEELPGAIEAAGREAAAAFGDGTLYLERLLPSPRHVEVQIVGDLFGHVIHVGDRDCSVQRRHQKVVEEAPAPDMHPSLVAALHDAAVRLGERMGYIGAGTVEFLVSGDEYWFLEMNTRLQVEHPVTEMTWDVDLVRLQLEVAMGAALPAQEDLGRPRGHAVEARLYAEDPAAGFVPRTGPVHRFEIPDLPGIRVDTGVEAGCEVTSFYDPLLAKVVAWGENRTEALRRLVRALRGARIHGPTTNRDLLVAVLEDPDMVAGRVDTGFLDRRDPAAMVRPDPAVRARHATAAALADQALARRRAPVLRSVRSGFRTLAAVPQRRGYAVDGGELTIGYRFGRRGLEVIEVDGEVLDAVVRTTAPDLVDLEVDGVRRRYRIARSGGRVFVDGPDGSTTLEPLPRFPAPEEDEPEGSLQATMPGTVLAVHVAEGDEVEAGTALVTLESMKMEQTLRAPDAGRIVEVRVAAGRSVDAGETLVVLA